MRKIAILNILVLFAILLAACAPQPAQTAEPTKAPAAQEPTATTAPAAEEPTAAPTEEPKSAFSEAPMLADMVSSGKLPPVEERLPVNPMVVAPLVEKGTYGGDMKFGFVGNNAPAAGWGGMLYLVGWEHLMTWKPDFNSIEPNIAENVDVSPDATTFTFYLRKGMKWSDGAPFTADDIMFYIEDVLYNKELFPNGVGADWLPKEYIEGFKAEKVDDYTVKMIFPKPYGTFLYQIATWSGRQFAMYPKHYLQKFHKTYNPDVDALVKEDGAVQDWVALFFKKSPDTWGDPTRCLDNKDLPTIGPWILEQPIGTGTQLVVVRNPYYWKVDTEGNQLPYIDRIIGIAYQDDSSRIFAMLNGDIDYIKDPGDPNRELFFGAVDEGKPIKVISNTPDGGNTTSIHFNLTAKDPVKNEVFNNKDFRIGMSYAINRAEIIEVVFKGQGTPAQVAPLEGSPLYNDQLANQYIEYDVAKANEYLDKVLPNKDAQGFRLDKNGKRFVPVFTVINDLSFGTHWIQEAELLVGYWKAVGVEVKIDSITDAVHGQRRTTNEFEMFMFHGGEGGAGITAILDPRWHVPGEYWGMFGAAWNLALDPTNKDGQKMPEYAQEVRDLFTKAIQQPTAEGQIEVMKQIMQKSADIFWCIGVSRPGPGYDVMSQRMMGIPDGYWGGWLEGVSKINRPEQWWLKQ